MRNSAYRAGRNTLVGQGQGVEHGVHRVGLLQSMVGFGSDHGCKLRHRLCLFHLVITNLTLS